MWARMSRGGLKEHDVEIRFASIVPILRVFDIAKADEFYARRA
jgi:hypothetical protein